MPLYNAGESIIDAYLKGVAVKQQNEARRMQMEATLAGIAQRDQAAKERIRTIDEKNKRETEEFKAQQKLREALFGVEVFNAKRGAAKDIAGGFIKNTDDLDAIVSGQAPVTAVSREEAIAQGVKKIALEEQAKQTARTVGAIETAKGLEQFKTREAEQAHGMRMMLQDAQALNLDKRQEDKQIFDAEQKRLDRQATRENTIIRANAVRSNKLATKEEKDAADRDMVDAHLPDIITGQVALEDIPKGQAGLKIQTEVKKQGFKILTSNERQHLSDLKMVENFYKQAKELSDEIEKGGFVGNVMSTRITELDKALRTNLTAMARYAKAEKGVISDKDIVRYEGLLPNLTPGGIKQGFKGDTKGRDKANREKVNEIIKSYFQKVKQIKGNMNAVQGEAVDKRFGLIQLQEK